MKRRISDFTDAPIGTPLAECAATLRWNTVVPRLGLIDQEQGAR
jgi:hypothetical protein